MVNRFHSSIPLLLERDIVFTAIIILLIYSGEILAKPPSDLPGEEITEKQFFDFITPRDSIEKKVPESSPESPTWLDHISKTWDAPPLSIQLAEDKRNIRIGMGAVFVPHISDRNLEPTIEIINESGKVVASGKTGRKYNLMPKKYYAILGSGAHNQRIVKTFKITESNIIPLIPDWSGLSIDVVDENNQPFRGEYELARMDKFDPFGRGTGRDINLGEEVKTWILKPGIYKIFGVGESYNTLTNFVTVRLLPGEYVRFTLVQKEIDMEIIGGGIIQVEPSSKMASNWKYGIDIGGSVDFNKIIDNNDTTNNTDVKSMTLVFRPKLNYKKPPVEFDNRLWLNEGVTFEEWDLSRLASSTDEIRLSSIFTWRFFPWLGPYGRLEMITELFPVHERVPENVSHYFIIYNEDYSLKEIDSVNNSYQMQPSLSPFTFESGVGANINAFDKRYFKAGFLTGIGLKYKNVRDESEKRDTSIVDIDTLDNYIDSLLYDIIYNESYTVIRKFNDKDIVEVGPEIVMNMTILLGRLASVESELKYFAPFERIKRPDITWRATLSWRLIRILTLDYEYEYTLKQPKEEALKQNESKHRILIRFSFISR